MIRNEKGQSIVEFALVVPILLLLLVSIVDFGRVLYTYSDLHFTAQETVRLAGLGKNDTEIRQFAINNFNSGNITGSMVDITPSTTNRKSGQYVTVTINYPFNLLTPFISRLFTSDGFIVISVDSTIRIE